MVEIGVIHHNHRNEYVYYTHPDTEMIKLDFKQLYSVYRDMAKN